MKFVCWLWRGKGFWKETTKYNERHVSVLASMLKRHGGHSLICVQDGSFDIPGSVIMPKRVRKLPDYLPKLWAWSKEFHEIIGERFVSIDLDVVIVGDLAPVVSGPEPLRIWDQAEGEPYNTSLFAIEPGFGNEVWDRLSPEALAIARLRTKRWTGDQSWVAYVLGKGQTTFSQRDGILQYVPALHRAEMPKGMLAGFMCGPFDPAREAKHSGWVKKSWK
jgi:hypothetical protein